MTSAPSCAVHVVGLSKTYRPSRKSGVVAVDGVSFRVEAGEVVALVGPNGAGKSTVLKSIAGLVRPTAGSVEVIVDGSRVRRREQHVALLPEHAAAATFGRLSVRENLDFFGGLEGARRREVRRRSHELVERLGLGDKVGTAAQLLSRGMRQKLALACALLADRPVLLLDEPTIALDAATAHQLEALLVEVAAAGRAVVVCSHDLSMVDNVAARVVVLRRGKVVTIDTPVAMRTLPATLRYDVVVRMRDVAMTADPLPRGVVVVGRRGGDIALEVTARDQAALSRSIARLPGVVVSMQLAGYDLAEALDLVLAVEE